MFDLSLSEVVLIVAVAVVFIGPKELPTVVRGVGKAMRALRGLTGEAKKLFDELSKESGLNEAKDAVNREITMIKGDDGQMYESYMVPITPKKEPEQ